MNLKGVVAFMFLVFLIASIGYACTKKKDGFKYTPASTGDWVEVYESTRSFKRYITDDEIIRAMSVHLRNAMEACIEKGTQLNVYRESRYTTMDNTVSYDCVQKGESK